MTRVKGLVLNASNNRATILTDQGEFKEVKTSGFIQAGEIWQDPPILIWKYACAAAVLLFMLAGGMSIFSVTAYAQVSSGVELGLNRWDRVVSVKALNNKGKQVLEKLDLKGKKVETAVEELTENNVEKTPGKPVISVITKNPGNEEAKKRIETKINTKVRNVIEKEQPNNNEAKTKNGSNSLAKPVQSSPGKSSNNEKKAGNSGNYNNTRRVPDNVKNESNESNIETVLPSENNSIKNLNKNNSSNNINNNNNNKDKLFINILQSESNKSSIKFYEKESKNNAKKKNKKSE